MSKPVVHGFVDSNAFSILASVEKALRKAGRGNEVEEYHKNATSGDYNHLLAVSMEYVDFDVPLDATNIRYDDGEQDDSLVGDTDEDSED